MACGGSDSITIEDFPESFIPKSLVEIDWTPSRILKHTQITKEVFKQQLNLGSQDEEVAYLAAALEKFRNLTRIANLGGHASNAKAYFQSPKELEILATPAANHGRQL